jgi:hypothetical protein
LGDIFCSTGGPSGGWVNSSTAGWLDAYNATQGSNASYCSFFGVACDEGTPSSLVLTASGLRGSLPPSLGNLSRLSVVDFSNNALSGSLPASLVALTRLIELRLNTNALSGSLPPGLGNLTALQQLWLNDNALTGTVPAELGSLRLQGLGLSDNRFTGSLPAFLLSSPYNKSVDGGVTFPGAMLTVCRAGQQRVGTLTTGNASIFFPAPICVDGCPAGEAATADGSSCVACPAGTYAYNASACSACPAGALCAGGGLLLPADGFWQVPSEPIFLQCPQGVCEAGVPPTAAARRLAETSCDAPADANCRCGHTGTLCGSCAPGWARAGQFCERCPDGSALAENAHGLLGGVVFIAVVLFLTSSFAFILSPVLQPERALAAIVSIAARCLADGNAGTPPPSGTALLARVRRALAYTVVPARVCIETLQIVASMARSMPLVAWPHIFNVLVLRFFAFFNMDFLILPATACGTPSANFEALFNGITIGVALFLLYAAALWLLGRSAMRALGRGSNAVAAYDRLMCSRLVFFLTITYAPIAQVCLRIAQCRRVGGSLGSVLWVDSSVQCTAPGGSGTYGRNRGAGGFWTTVYVTGVPVLFAALLRHYRVHEAAAERTADARLAALLQEAARRRVPMPSMTRSEEAALTTGSVGEDHLEALYAEFIAPPQLVGDEAKGEPPRSDKLVSLLAYSASHLPLPPVRWAEDDERLDGARAAIGCLFADYAADRWYWSLVETLYKLLITAVLGFIAAGSEAQAAAGVLFSFLMLLAFQRAQPYTDRVRTRRAACGGLRRLRAHASPRAAGGRLPGDQPTRRRLKSLCCSSWLSWCVARCGALVASARLTRPSAACAG